MIKKRKWIIVSVAAAVVVVAVGVFGGTVWAKSGNSSTAANQEKTNPQTVLADKVANILGLDNATVEEAFTQAMAEIKEERQAAMLEQQKARLDQLVADGKITEEQAAKMKEWMESKPDVSIQGFNFGDNQGNGKFGPGKMGPGNYAPGERTPGNMMFRGQRPGNSDTTDNADNTD